MQSSVLHRLPVPGEPLALRRIARQDGRMATPSSRELHALRNLISEADLFLETAPPLPENRTTAARDLPRSAIALVEDFIEYSTYSPAAVLGSKGGNAAAVAFWSSSWSKMRWAITSSVSTESSGRTAQLRS